jgi:hypothetical protein
LNQPRIPLGRKQAEQQITAACLQSSLREPETCFLIFDFLRGQTTALKTLKRSNKLLLSQSKTGLAPGDRQLTSVRLLNKD